MRIKNQKKKPFFKMRLKEKHEAEKHEQLREFMILRIISQYVNPATYTL